MLSFRLFSHSDTIGALNLYARGADAFTDRDAHLGTLFAAHAAMAMSATMTQANLSTALDNRDLIGQAKGILMERFKVDDVTAFTLLAEAASRTNRKVRDIAAHLAHTGEMFEAGQASHRV